MDQLGLTALYAAHVRGLCAAYDEVLDRHGFRAVVLHAGAAQKRSSFDDQYWPLRPTPHYQHWVPFAEADGLLVIAVQAKPRLLWVRSRDFWERAPGPDASGDYWRGAVELCELPSLERQRSEVPAGEVAFICDARDVAAAARLGIDAAAVNPPALLLALDELRVRKSPYEVHCVDQANRIAAVGHRAVAAAFMAGESTELDLHLLYLRATRQDDVETPYKNIVALGHHAATLHHIHYVKEPRHDAESLLVDAGASYLGYTSDVTRTYTRGHGATRDAFAALVEGATTLQKTLCMQAQPGQHYESLHDDAHRLLGELLVDRKLVKCSGEAAVASGLTRRFFPHGLGHSLGLQCHDVGCAELRPRADNPFLRNTTIIAEGQLFTIEPGIYFIDQLLDETRASEMGRDVDWRLVDELTPYGGVRIEDDLVVRGDGLQNLTRAHLP